MKRFPWGRDDLFFGVLVPVFGAAINFVTFRNWGWGIFFAAWFVAAVAYRIQRAVRRRRDADGYFAKPSS